MRSIEIRVLSLEAAGREIVDAWQKAECDVAPAEPRETLSFESIEAMQRTLTPNRWELLRTLQAEGPMGVRELARRLKRDVKNAHTDLAKLKELGLVEDAEGGGVWVPFDEIRAEFTVRREAA